MFHHESISDQYMSCDFNDFSYYSPHFIWLMLIVSFLFRYYHLHRNHIWQLILDYHY